MVVKRRLFVAVACVVTLALALPASTLGGFEAIDPDPLRKEPMLRVKDIAANARTGVGQVVAIGWREGASPPGMFMAISLDGGQSYLKGNGKMRRYRIAGDGVGMSLAICDGRVWAGTAAQAGSDAGTRESDPLLTTRTIGGGSHQAFMTQPSKARKVRDVSIACVGNSLIAIGWLEQSNGAYKARLMLRSLEPPGEKPSFTRTFWLGPALFKGGLSVAATTESVHVTWTAETDKHLMYKRFLVADGEPPVVSKQPSRRLAKFDIQKPQLAARGQKVVVAYGDAGKVKVKQSSDAGASWGGPTLVVGTGSKRAPSRAYSVDVAGNRIVVEAVGNKAGSLTRQRIQTFNQGGSWSSRPFGHNGDRVGALLRKPNGDVLLREAWHNNGSAFDTLRGQLETN